MESALFDNERPSKAKPPVIRWRLICRSVNHQLKFKPKGKRHE
jgi:hypothetical protein